MPSRRSPTVWTCLFGALLALPFTSPARAEDKPAPSRLNPAGIDGALVLCGGGQVPEKALARFVELAGGDKAHLVVIPTAAENEPDAEALLAPWKARKPASVVVLHTRDRKKADEAAFTEPLRKATGVWFMDGSPSRLTDSYLDTAVEAELSAVLKRGAVIGGTAAVLSRVTVDSSKPETIEARGFDLLPGAAVDRHLEKRDGSTRLLGVLEKRPGLVGFGIDEDTALVVRGREMRVVGSASVTVWLGKSATREPREVVLKAGAVSDLTMWRRAALARTEPPFPPKEVPVPEVAGDGSLVIVGGGGMPTDVTKKFIELAGGPDALIVVLPTAQPDPLPERAEAGFLEKAGARNVQVLPGRQRKDVEAPANLEVLKKARGIWFGGGRQWRFMDAYEGTKAEPLFRDVLRRGGVIGGSSAGATIQGDYLCRGSPLGNEEVMCEGYERGLAFLPGVAIDQHFSQRNRFADMTGLMKTHPQLLGIGLDEATAIVVQGHVAEVLGRNQVQFFDRRKTVEDGKSDYDVVRPGERYDLKARTKLEAK